MSTEHIITNARVVTRSDHFLGTVVFKNGTISKVDDSVSRLRQAEDWSGDYLLPGLIELHTDNLEKHLMPRPGVKWPDMPALLSHDAEIAAAGITTVFDALGIGDVDERAMRGQSMQGIASSIDHAERGGLLRAEHRLHLRCELPAANVIALFEPFAGNPRVGMISLMDHTPGQRQWTSLHHARTYYTGKKGWSNEKFDQVVAESLDLQARFVEPHRSFFVDHARLQDVPLASHDDTTAEHIAQARAEGVSISEFPTTVDAARSAKVHGLGVIMGAPNMVRGGSHSGNVSAADLARAKLLDAFSSDYVPSSLMHAAFLLIEKTDFTLPEAIATVSINPARMARMDDRGEIAVGKRSDYCRVRVTEGIPGVTATWKNGRRVI